MFLVAIDLFLLGFACIKVRFLTIFWKMFYMQNQTLEIFFQVYFTEHNQTKKKCFHFRKILSIENILYSSNPLGRYMILYIFFVILFYFGNLFGLDSGKVLVFIFVFYIWFYFIFGKVLFFFFFFFLFLISNFLCNFLSAKKNL